MSAYNKLLKSKEKPTGKNNRTTTQSEDEDVS